MANTSKQPEKKDWTPEQVKQFKIFEKRVAAVTFAKKCEYPDDYMPDIEPAPKKDV